jgi:hypothetical protein
MMLETPRNIAILAVVVAVLSGVVTGTLGYMLAQIPSQPINVNVHLDAPIVVQPSK